MNKPRAAALVAAIVLMSPPLIAGDTTAADERFHGLAERIKRIEITPELRARAQAIADEAKSEVFRAQVQQQQDSLARQSGIEPMSDKDREAFLREEDRVFVFISSSVPLSTLRAYAIDLERIPGSVMVLRGFVGGSEKLKPTVQLIADVLRTNPNCKPADCKMRGVNVVVDPFQFRRFGVDRVPAIVFAPGSGLGQYCDENTPANLRDTRHGPMIIGGTSLRYALAEINRHASHPSLEQIMSVLERPSDE